LSSKKLTEAEAQVDTVLETTQDRCQLAKAWRKRGNILFERSRLDEAYAAYQKSLEYEPANKVAVQEMLFIAREAQRLGGLQARAFKEYKPPSASAQAGNAGCTED
jgi:tetratricopeptide (TPR) repeat protein